MKNYDLLRNENKQLKNDIKLLKFKYNLLLESNHTINSKDINKELENEIKKLNNIIDLLKFDYNSLKENALENSSEDSIEIEYVESTYDSQLNATMSVLICIIIMLLINCFI